jgi:N-acetylmuramoyl-L-alanine amidase
LRKAAKLVEAVAIALAAAIFVVESACAAVLTSAAFEHHDNVVELHFGVRGRGLKWHLSAHDQQLWIDLENTRLALPSLDGWESLPITRIQAIDVGNGDSRLALEVSGKVDYVVARLPGQLIVRFAPAGEAPDIAAPLLQEVDRARTPAGAMRATRAASHQWRVPAAAPPAAAALEPSSAADSSQSDATPERTQTAALTPPGQVSNRPLVVIDPGHGGHDPGTEIAGTVVEKDLALAIALRLESALRDRGFATLLTRQNDTFLTLGERTEVANRAHADLFISVHLNSSPDAGTSGIETYYLNNTTDRATIRLARMENGVAGGYSAPGQSDLNYILTDLRQGYKANESASLARMIEAETAADISTSLGLRVNALGAKKGPFYVLVGAEMPAVLVECGFLSNADEARELTDPRYQAAIADGVADAVVHYFNADAAVGNL